MFADRRAKLAAWARIHRQRVTRAARSASRSVTKWRAELLLVAAVLGGWVSLTIGVSALLARRVTLATWALSIGLLLLSACGWGFLGNTAFRGIYVLTRKGDA